ncbi:unnamed protein product [Echinostoma caproni]|uniref:Uncharacterized protein n=1 Tax=Echinostoma caproni TaxID=27848 RepID=A0A3P8CIY4_9TREM|nr:unnamed protein product [Echinostoma caproni]
MGVDLPPSCHIPVTLNGSGQQILTPASTKLQPRPKEERSSSSNVLLSFFYHPAALTARFNQCSLIDGPEVSAQHPNVA